MSEGECEGVNRESVRESVRESTGVRKCEG